MLPTLLASTLSAGSINMEPCFVEGSAKALECAMLPVPKTYRDDASSTVNIHMIRANALASSNKPPIFVMAGGPGQAATEMTSMLNNAFKDVRKQHDVIFVAQRGSGLSTPQPCHNADMVSTQDMQLAFAECQKRIAPVMPQLTTDVLVDDIESVRQALGYREISLWGGSYGTFAAQHYATKYTQHVDKLVLDAVVALDANPLVAGGIYPQQSLERLDAICQQDRDCRTHFPNWVAQFKELLSKTEQSPIPMEVDGKAMVLDSMTLAHLVRTALYAPSVSTKLPMAIDRAHQGDARLLSAINKMISGAATDSMYLGLTLAVLCQEHVYQDQAEAAKIAGQDSFTQDSYYQFWLEGCATEKAEQADYIRVPESLDMPSLLISGSLDPITPEQSAEQTLSYLTKAQHIVIPNAGHTNSYLGCMPKLINEFLLAGKVEDASCITRHQFPPFLK